MPLKHCNVSLSHPEETTDFRRKVLILITTLILDLVVKGFNKDYNGQNQSEAQGTMRVESCCKSPNFGEAAA